MKLLYLGEQHLRQVGLKWEELVDRIEATVKVIDKEDYAQPLKPYLRYRDPVNRIIAMPAYIGGDIHAAGLKWIASFPANPEQRGIPRAHSVTVLNDADTGEPRALINTALASAARTAAVSGLMLRHWLAARPQGTRIKVGIIGLGPIGRLHHEMCAQLFADRIDRLMTYDIRQVPETHSPSVYPGGLAHDGLINKGGTAHGGTINLGGSAHVEAANHSDAGYARWIGVGEAAHVSAVNKGEAAPTKLETVVAGSWQELYESCNVIITCTVSSQRYIDIAPAPGSLLLDVSLRDYKLEAIRNMRAIVVDDWTEVCRENTDIELLHLHNGLTAEGADTLADVVCRQSLSWRAEAEPVLFCPMGMASFDVAVADWFAQAAEQQGIGIRLA